MFNVVKNLVAAGCPVGGVAMKIEIDLNYNSTMIDGIKSNIERYFAEQLFVHMTDVEVRCIYDAEAEDSCASWDMTDKQKQAHVYSELLKICLDADNCSAFELKGVSEQYQTDHVHGLLFDENNTKKSSFFKMISTLTEDTE